MKILHIASGDTWAGAEVQVWTLCTELVKQGQTVHAIILNPGRLAEMLAESGVTVTVLDERRFGFGKLLEKIKLELHRYQPDVIHTHRQKENILGSLANKMTISVPAFRTVHGAPEFTPSLKQRIQIGADRFTGKRLQHGIISVSDDLTQKLTGQFPVSKIHTIANGIDPEAVRKDASAHDGEVAINDQTNSLHVGFVGRMESVKRVDLFLQMAELVHHNANTEHPVHFHLFGGGSLLEEHKSWAARHKLNESVTFHGHTTIIRSWIARMDLLVMPSDHEGLPMTALESLALGVPMVTHATGGLIPLLKAAGCNGLVEKHCAAGYAERVEALLKAPPNVALPEAYTAARNANEIVALYQSALTG